MSFRFTLVETSLNKAEFRWKWLKFLQHTFLLGGILCGLLLLFGAAILLGWVTSKASATGFFVVLGMAGFIVWAVVVIIVLAGSPERNWLATALERVNPHLLDRLHTLLFLEGRPKDSRTHSFALRIARQTQWVLAAKEAPKPFSGSRALQCMLGFIVALTATILLYQVYSPWNRLLAAEKAKTTTPAQDDKPLELTLPMTNNAEQNQTWGEVRITDPGGDLRVTKVDVVPLQIEAAANQALRKVGWFSTINGAAETSHDLPPPSEPRYAVYQPTVYLDELRLSDWDVMTYYAKADTEKQNSFASDVFFLEVRPFREDILKMPGGENGQAYQCLNELSALISRQQHVIRQTHQHLQKPQEQENLQSQDRKKLSEAEADLADSTQHLYAKMAARMENKPIGEALDNLAKAEKSLDRASTLLSDNVMNEAQNRERHALAELAAARKMFQKAVSDNPDAFADGSNSEDTSPTAEAMQKLNAKRLNEMAEFRNEAKAAQQFVDKALQQQRNLEQQARTSRNTDYPRLSDEQRQLHNSLADFQQLHPRAFQNTEAESQQAQDAMSKAAESLRKKGNDARNATQKATQELQKLGEAMQNKSAGQQLADAYKLKQMLDKQIQTLGQCANPNASTPGSGAQADQASGEARETLNQLKKVAEQEPTRDAFGPPLRSALSGTNKVDLDSKLARVQLAQDEPTKRERAGEAKDALSKVSKAFEQSEPKAMQMAQNTDSLKPGDQESFNQGMGELESLIKQLEENRQMSPENQGKQGREALGNLQSGMRGLYGKNERAALLLSKLDKMLKPEQAFPIEDLKKLLSELQHFSFEAADQMERRQDKPEVTNIDPTRLPPAYRGRITKYFPKALREMSADIVFEFPQGWLLGLPLLALLVLIIWRQRRRGLANTRIAALSALRLLTLLVLVFLAARPIWMSREPPASATRSVMLLLDRSESMSLEEREANRYQQALGFLRERLLPALKGAGLPVQAMLFDQAAEPADGAQLGAAIPHGKRTNLGGAIAQALGSAAQPPLAVIALTDGIVNESSENIQALTGLVDARVPFIGVGFGSDHGVRTLSLREVEAPPIVSTKTAFSIAAQLEMINTEEMPAFDVVLFRDGQMAQKKSVVAGKGSRTWLESFPVTEDKQGVHTYAVQLLPPSLPGLKCVNTVANTSVRISDEKELRVLYIQGALTWDYKFISLSLRNDQTIKMTGLTRTSKQSVFRQNVESAGELMNGFPTSLAELAPFRVVVLSNLRPTDLTPAQQDVLARFCGELGGGVLMIGGAATFDATWQGSRLEQLLPVVFAVNRGVQGLDRPFRMELTEDAVQHPVFQIVDNRATREAWAQLPTFTQYGRVDAAKPGAQVWAVHQTDDGPTGRRILMASQRYGAGLSAVVCIQNFWRWRLAKDSEPQQFDRFWRQLFRFLSEVGRQDVSIHLAEQDLHPQMDVRVVLEKQPNPKSVTDANHKFFVRVEDGQKKLLHEGSVELEAGRPVDFKFHAEKADVYTITVSDPMKVPIATRPVEIRDVNIEFQETARNMETLQQWASISEGLAVKVEDCRDAADLVSQIRAKIEQVRRGKPIRSPIGVNGWLLTLVVGCLGGEWLLRKRWGLV